MATDRLVVGCHDFVLSQVGQKMNGKTNLSHPGYEIDICCEDTGISFWWNKMPNTYWKCGAKWGTSNTRFFWSSDEKGNPKKVLLANGHEEYVTLAFTHDNNPVAVGTLVPPGAVIAKEGVAGIATGNHMHLEIATGRKSYKVGTGKRINGMEIYAMPNQIDPRDALWIWDGFTKRSETLGMVFKHCSEVEVKAEKVEGIELKAFFEAYGGSCQIRRLETVNGKVTFSKVVGLIVKGEKVPFTGDPRTPTYNGYQMAQIYQKRTNTYGWVPLDMTSKDGDLMYRVIFEM